MKILKYGFLGLAGLLLVYLLTIAWTLNAYRFKVTDPSDPKFKAENFKFEDYFFNKNENIGDVIVKIFPIGTERSKIEDILVNKNGAKIYDYSDRLKLKKNYGAKIYIMYDYVPWWNNAYKIFGLLNGVMFDGAIFRVRIYYDDNNKVVRID